MTFPHSMLYKNTIYKQPLVQALNYEPRRCLLSKILLQLHFRSFIIAQDIFFYSSIIVGLDIDADIKCRLKR